ncbi:MAG: hypothetical protein WC852_06350 [Candidatus Nanoarchaeia archaeon]|jgi:hypothetical protein
MKNKINSESWWFGEDRSLLKQKSPDFKMARQLVYITIWILGIALILNLFSQEISFINPEVLSTILSICTILFLILILGLAIFKKILILGVGIVRTETKFTRMVYTCFILLLLIYFIYYMLSKF